MKHSSKSILIFNSYSPQIYSGLDKYNLLLSKKLVEKGFVPVIIFSNSINEAPQIVDDLISVGAKIELLKSSSSLKLIKEIGLLFLRYKPAIVHSHFVNSIKIICGFYAIIFRCKYYITFHSLITGLKKEDYLLKKGIIKKNLLLIYLRLLISLSTKIFTISEEIRQELYFFTNGRSKKIKKLYLGVQLAHNTKSPFELRKMLCLPKNQVIFCNISAIENIKGIDLILRAISLLKKQYNLTDFLFCHIGGLRTNDIPNSKYRDSLLLLSKELNIEKQVIWMGKRNDINEILPVFDFYVHPSRMEGLGVANMEAASHSLPIIGSRVGGIPEIVKHNENGFLFNSENENELADSIFKMINDKSLTYKMGIKSFKIAEKYFNMDIGTDSLINYYLENT